MTYGSSFTFLKGIALSDLLTECLIQRLRRFVKVMVVIIENSKLLIFEGFWKLSAFHVVVKFVLIKLLPKMVTVNRSRNIPYARKIIVIYHYSTKFSRASCNELKIIQLKYVIWELNRPVIFISVVSNQPAVRLVASGWLYMLFSLGIKFCLLWNKCCFIHLSMRPKLPFSVEVT